MTHIFRTLWVSESTTQRDTGTPLPHTLSHPPGPLTLLAGTAVLKSEICCLGPYPLVLGLGGLRGSLVRPGNVGLPPEFRFVLETPLPPPQSQEDQGDEMQNRNLQGEHLVQPEGYVNAWGSSMVTRPTGPSLLDLIFGGGRLYVGLLSVPFSFSEGASGFRPAFLPFCPCL